MSTLNVANVTDGTTTVSTSYVVNGSAKAWIHFNGTGTAVIDESFNFSSLTDSGTGNFTTFFTASMENGNFSISSATDQVNVTAYNFLGSEMFGTQAGTAVSGIFRPNTTTDTKADLSKIRRTIHGDLA